MIDVDTLNDNLERVGQPRVATGESELVEIMELLDTDNKFRDEWADVPPPA